MAQDDQYCLTIVKTMRQKVNAEGLTPLHVICKGFQNDDQLETLFKICEERNQLVQVDAQDNLGNTPLHLAVCYGKHWAAELLLRNGANPNLADVEGYTPLHVICKRDDLDYYKNLDLAELIFSKTNKKKHGLLRVNAQDKLGHTPLYLALDNGYKKLAEFLLRKGANPNIANEDGSTPLHIMCKKDNDDDLVDAFFEISDEKHQLVRIDARDNLGRTPLQWAVARFLPNTVEVLLNRGADLSKFAFPTESPYDVRYKTQPFKHNFQLQLAAGAMIVVELLEAKGYELDQNEALTVMKFFAKYELFDKSEELEKCWLDNEEFTSKAQKMMIKRRFSLYKLLGLRPKKAARQVNYWGYLELAYSEVAWRLPEKSIQASGEAVGGGSGARSRRLPARAARDAALRRCRTLLSRRPEVPRPSPRALGLEQLFADVRVITILPVASSRECETMSDASRSSRATQRIRLHLCSSYHSIFTLSRRVRSSRKTRSAPRDFSIILPRQQTRCFARNRLCAKCSKYRHIIFLVNIVYNCTDRRQDVLLAHESLGAAAEPVTVILAEVEGPELAALLGLVYTGSASVPRPRLEAFLRAAEALRIPLAAPEPAPPQLTDQQQQQQQQQQQADHKPQQQHGKPSSNCFEELRCCDSWQHQPGSLTTQQQQQQLLGPGGGRRQPVANHVAPSPWSQLLRPPPALPASYLRR
ncbi:unnamed protein product, partial [Trichogramma brassicae]